MELGSHFGGWKTGWKVPDLEDMMDFQRGWKNDGKLLPKPFGWKVESWNLWWSTTLRRLELLKTFQQLGGGTSAAAAAAQRQRLGVQLPVEPGRTCSVLVWFMVVFGRVWSGCWISVAVSYCDLCVSNIQGMPKTPKSHGLRYPKCWTSTDTIVSAKILRYELTDGLEQTELQNLLLGMYSKKYWNKKKLQLNPQGFHHQFFSILVFHNVLCWYEESPSLTFGLQKCVGLRRLSVLANFRDLTKSVDPEDTCQQ